MINVTEEIHRMRPKWFLNLRYVRRKLCTYLASRLALSPNRLKHPLEPCHLEVPSGASKMISGLRLAQAVYLSYIDTNSVSKWIETIFHMTNVTDEIHRVHLKRFLSLWYICRKPCTYFASRLALYPNRPKRATTWTSSPRGTIGCIHNDFWAYDQCKPCTYLVLRLELSPNRPKWASTWASSPRSVIGCVQNDFCAYGMFGTNRAPILHWHYHCLRMDWNEIPHDQCHIGDPSGASKTIFEPMARSTQTVHLSCVKISTISKQTKASIHLSLITLEYHRVRPKRFLSLWYVWHKPSTYFAPILTLSPNGPK
jgi:hypothetical protein